MIKKLCRIVIEISIILSVILLLVKPLRNLNLILGLLIGGYYSVIRTYIFESYFKTIIYQDKLPKYKLLFKTIFSQIINFFVLLLAILVNTNFFIGVTIGVLILPFVITINSIKNRGVVK